MHQAIENYSISFPDTKVKILIVDDEAYICTIISRFLVKEGFDCSVAYSADEAMQVMKKKDIGLLITDINMPHKNGIELLQYTRTHHEDTAVIMVTAVDDRDTAIYALHLGAFGYIIKPFNEKEMLINVANAIERRSIRIERKEYERVLEQKVEERTQELRRREELMVLRLVAAAKYRDEETGTHIRRLGLYSAELAEALGWDSARVRDIRLAATMHDMGKIGIPDEILLKPGKLTDQEFAFIKKHPQIGADLLQNSGIELLDMAADIALYHHERWDGSGYPVGLAGMDIPEAARIVAIADVYDALANDRVYRPAFPEEKVIALMREGRGSHFDPDIFDLFLQTLPELRKILTDFSDKPL